MALAEFEAVDSASAAKQNVRRAIESVAKRLGNTPTICRKCYVHPEIFNGYLDGDLLTLLTRKIEGELSKLRELSAAEATTLALLHRRLAPARRTRHPWHKAGGKKPRPGETPVHP